MSWIMIALTVGAVVLIAAIAAVLAQMQRKPDSGTAVPLDSTASLFGLAPEDATHFEQAARTADRRERSGWMSDYQAESAAPGRVAGIPPALRVRR